MEILEGPLMIKAYRIEFNNRTIGTVVVVRVALVLLVPYTRGAAGEPITYGEMEGAVRPMQIWTGNEP